MAMNWARTPWQPANPVTKVEMYPGNREAQSLYHILGYFWSNFHLWCISIKHMVNTVLVIPISAYDPPASLKVWYSDLAWVVFDQFLRGWVPKSFRDRSYLHMGASILKETSPGNHVFFLHIFETKPKKDRDGPGEGPQLGRPKMPRGWRNTALRPLAGSNVLTP